MRVDIKLSSLPESVEEATLMTWYKKEGEPVKRDEKIADVETDKVVLEVAAEADGVLEKIVKKAGDLLAQGDLLGIINTNGVSGDAPRPDSVESSRSASVNVEGEMPMTSRRAADGAHTIISPAAKKMIEERGLDPAVIEGTGKGGRVTKTDVLRSTKEGPEKMEGVQATGIDDDPTASKMETAPMPSGIEGDRPDQRVPMTRLRARIAERLVDAQQTAAILTTFNEVNLQAIVELRQKYKEPFEKKHGTRLGFISFFVKASVEALKKFPLVNASVDGHDIIYHGYYDIGIAVSSPRGLVVPILRDADQLNFAGIETKIVDFAQRAKEARLSMEELTGGTFTITNGGVFGSMLSTPILNPPQSAILGMHTIQQRPVVEEGEVVARPMMYLALSYDHRIIDGKEAVSFLVTIKEQLEDPSRVLLGI